MKLYTLNIAGFLFRNILYIYIFVLYILNSIFSIFKKKYLGHSNYGSNNLMQYSYQ